MFGCIMRSCSIPIICDIAMSKLESEILNTSSLQISLYIKYEDDILLLAPNQHVNHIFKVLNSFQQKLHFSSENPSEKLLFS